METIYVILLCILAVIVLIGIVRLIFSPATNLVDFILELFLIDWLGDLFVGILEVLGDIFSNSDTDW